MTASVEKQSGRKLRGEVVRVTVRRLKSGRISHDTRIEFYPDEDGHPFGSVRIQGRLENLAETWDAELLTALRSRYDVPGLPEPRWVTASTPERVSTSDEPASGLVADSPQAEPEASR